MERETTSRDAIAGFCIIGHCRDYGYKRRSPRKCRFVCSFLLTLAALGADAAVYRWVDENGRIQFGDRPPAGQGEEVKLRVPPSQPTAGSDQRERRQIQHRMLDIYREDREAKKEAKAKAREEAAKRAENCRRAQSRLERFSQASGIYKRDEEGNRVFLSHEDRDRYIRELEEDVARWCGK